MIFKRIGSICFALAFMLAIVVFANVGAEYIPREIAKTGMIISGGTALLMNLLSFRYDSYTENNNLVFWIGSVLVFAGLIMKIRYIPYNQMILIAGLGIVGLSYFYNPFAKKDTQPEDELLDQ